MSEASRIWQSAVRFEPGHRDARRCFGLLVRALEQEWLDAEDLADLLEESRRPTWGGSRFEEFGIEPDWGDARHTHLRITLLAEQVRCPREPFMSALERLVRTWRAER